MKYQLGLTMLLGLILLLPGCSSTPDDSGGKENEGRPIPAQIGKGTFRIRHISGGPYVAWAHRPDNKSHPYVELWITRKTHITPGSINSVTWILDLVTDGSDRDSGGNDAIGGNPTTFATWVKEHGDGMGVGVPASELKQLYCHDVTVKSVP